MSSPSRKRCRLPSEAAQNRKSRIRWAAFCHYDNMIGRSGAGVRMQQRACPAVVAGAALANARFERLRARVPIATITHDLLHALRMHADMVRVSHKPRQIPYL